MKNKKKGPSNVLVVLTIIFLSIFIILPPVFRTTMKKETNNTSSTVNKNNNSEDNKIVALSCKYESSKYSISSNTTYNNDEITKISLSYSENAYSDEENPSTENEVTTVETPDTAPDIVMAFNQEKEALTKLIDAEYTNEGFTTKIILTQKTFKSNETNELIINRFQDLNSQKKYYEGLGYTCQKLSN